MPAAPLDARERSELCDLMLAAGPDAPTLCAGWDVIDLAAHLVIREHDLRAPLIILGGDRFTGLESRLMGSAKSRGLEPLVDRLRTGPPLPWRTPGLRPLLNLNEWFVHHEDVRRAGGPAAPRADRPDLDAALWHHVRTAARFMLRSVRDARVVLVAPGHGEVAHGKGPAARVVGGPQELVLYLNGRRTAAQVEIEGDAGVRAALEMARFGI
ncbi:MAG TPA: TIGR03085 family metal-binding protein [Acidimicrobiales bacterium]